ncbi:MAG: class B sortase [Coriobacteriales bacterium]|jgi:sortase B|nr:class B sortase [Coriobacteriales bacterium]
MTSEQPPTTSNPDPKVPVVRKYRRTIAALTVLLVVLLLSASGGIGWLIWEHNQREKAAQELAETPIPTVEQPVASTPDTPEVALPDNPIDFASIQQTSPDVYAWIYIPGTPINYPVVQHPNDDFFYIDHNPERNYAFEGSIFTEMANSLDFSDPITVIYGHNMHDETMFSTLHYFEDADFFAENDEMIIYTPGHILTYRIISAYQYDNRHILNSYDFSNPEVLADYQEYVRNPDSLLVNTRDVPLTSTDKIVQLSTCMTVQNWNRYLVNGVLIDDHLTN